MNETLPTLLNQSQPVWFRPWRFDAAGQVLHLPQQTSASRPSRRSCRDCEKNLSNRNERKLCPAKLSLVRRGGTLCQVRNTSFWFSASCTLPPPTLIVQQSANEAQILSPQPSLLAESPHQRCGFWHLCHSRLRRASERHPIPQKARFRARSAL